MRDKNPLTPISDSELEILRLIWRNGGQSRFGPLLDELLQQGREWKSNTILTFLTRLVDKGYLKVEKNGRLNIYHALVSEKDYMDNLTQSFVDKVYEGDVKGLMAALIQQKKLTNQDLEELHSFWKEAKEK